MPTPFDRFLEVYQQISLSFGVVDIYFDDSTDVAERVGAFTFLMNQARFSESSVQVGGVLVVAPPLLSQLGCDQPAIEAATVKAAEEKFGRSLSEVEVASVSKFVTVSHAKDFGVDSAIEPLVESPAGSAVVILHAAMYRNEPSRGVALSFPALPENLWVPHLCNLAEKAVTAAKSVNCYVLIDAGEAKPYRPENQSQIHSIADCGIFGLSREFDGAKLVADNLQTWQELVKSGQLGSAFTSIDALPVWMDSQKSFLKLQLIERVLPGEHIVRLIRDDPKMIATSDRRNRLKLAKIASRSNDDELALELLVPVIPELRSEEDLALAADLAGDLGEFELLEGVLERSGTLFPTSIALLDHKLKMYLMRRQYSEILALLSNSPAELDPERRFFYVTLAAGLNSAPSPGYQLIVATITSATPDYGDWARISCANEAIARHEYTTAIGLCEPSGGEPVTKGLANVLITAMKHRLLERTPDGKSLVVGGDELVAPVTAVIRYLSSNPIDGTTRQRLTSTLAPETSGILGLAVLVLIANQLAPSTQLKESPTVPPAQTKPSDEAEIIEAIKKVFEWAEQESPVFPGFTKFPKDLLQVSADDLFAVAQRVVKSEEDLRETPGAEIFDKWFMIAVLLAPHTQDPNEDLDLIRFAGARYIAANKPQRGRDFAEHALQITYGTPERRRLAWLAFADIYDRSKSFNEALLGISCALAVPVPIDIDQLYQEATLLIRIYRDIHFTQYAADLTSWLLQMCEDFNLGERYKLRLKTLELQLRVLEAQRQSENASEQLQRLTTELAGHCRDLAKVGEDTAPATVFLAHCVQLCSGRGISVGEEVRETFEKNLATIPSATAAMIQISNQASARGADLLKVAQSIELARNAEDIAFDLLTFAIACRRFLDSGIDGDSIESAAFVIEALSDHALKESLVGTKDSPFESIGRSLAMAIDLSLRGMNVIMVGLSERGTLVRLSVMDGTVKLVREPEEIFSEKKYRAWTDHYPYGYAMIGDPMNLFYVTLTGIGLSESPCGPTVMIMDNSLQQMPPNLMMMGDNLAGRQAPMAGAPSLSWLWAVQLRTLKTGKKAAWISTEFAEDRSPALITVAGRLQETLDQYGISLRTTAQVPDDLAESELVIVAAHGSILPEGRYVQRISNDAELALYPAVLANAVRKSAVVILFICSGGRLDTHPNAETTIGLVRQILDAGCATVIAAPWPLDIRVPSHWLPAFLKHWTAGQTVIEASYAGNQNVAQQMGDSPLDSLAMNVFGDPFRVHGESSSRV